MKCNHYAAILHPETCGGFSVRFPQFAGCVSDGDDLISATCNAYDALLLHVLGMREDGEKLPEPERVDRREGEECVVLFPVMVDDNGMAIVQA